MELNVSIDTSRLKERLAKIRGGLGDLSEPLASSGEDLLELYGGKNFEAQGAALQSKWKSLAASTLLARSRRWGHYAAAPIATDKILVWTGALKNGFKKTVQRTTLVIENTVEYFKFNQGARKMLALNNTATDIVSKHLMEYIRNLTK